MPAKWVQTEKGYVWDNFKVEEVEMAGGPNRWYAIHKEQRLALIHDVQEAMDYCESFSKRLKQ